MSDTELLYRLISDSFFLLVVLLPAVVGGGIVVVRSKLFSSAGI